MIRKGKQRAVIEHVRLMEPTRRLLASNLLDLSERTETIAKESDTGREQLASQVRSVDAKLNAIIAALGIAPAAGAVAGASAAPAAATENKAGVGWLQSLMGDASSDGTMNATRQDASAVLSA